MPVKSTPKERPIIEMLLSAYDNDTWKSASFDWVEEHQDGAVELIATRVDRTTLALEHTLIQPFVGEKFDSESFITAFGRLEKNPLLVLPETRLDVVIPVSAIPKGYDWNEVGEALLAWLIRNRVLASKVGKYHYKVPVESNSKSGILELNISLETTSLPGMMGTCLISRDEMPRNLATIVEKALKTKIPKLVRTLADRRILLLEIEQSVLSDSEVYGEIVKLSLKFPDLAKIDEIWFANTSILVSERWCSFTLMDGRGAVETLTFENSGLKKRRDDRLLLGPPRREF